MTLWAHHGAQPKIQPQLPKNVGVFATFVFLCLVLGGAKEGWAARPNRIHRFALVAGANDGGSERTRLRYANSDAKSFANVLVEFGGVNKDDLILLTDVTRQSLKDAFVRINRRLKSARKTDSRTELIFYYSGHSNEQGLLLQNDVFSYLEIKQRIDTLPAAVRIGILDSCASGTLVRMKGGKRTAPFLIDGSSEVNGVALLTSSASDEVAQESDKVQGSYFTHYLVSGMRGAADADRDGRVTLNESYKYAFDETLHRTADSQAGAQHPNYDFRLAGSGDIVLTDLRTVSNQIIIANEIKGFVYVRDDRGHLIAEIDKRTATPVKIGVMPGSYEVTIAKGGIVRRGTVKVTAVKPLRINQDTLPVAWLTSTVSRGEGRDAAEGGDMTPRERGEKAEQYRPFALSLLPDLTTNGSRTTRNSLALNFLGKGHSLDGIEIGYFFNIRTHLVRGVQIAQLHNSAGSLKGIQVALTNHSRHDAAGVQFALVNLGHATLGVQGGLVNLNRDTFVGIQGGFINSNVDMNGIQAGLVNLQRGELKGVQAGFVNTGATTIGTQAGLVNVNKFSLFGTQLGLVNYARAAKGLQLGLVNIVKDDFEGVQLGLVNYAGNGLLAPGMWVSETGQIDLVLKMGNRHMYSILGFNPSRWTNQKREVDTIGLGVHFELHPVWLEIDAIHQWHPYDNENANIALITDAVAKLRWSIGYRFFDRLSIFGGLSLNNMISSKRTFMARSPGLSFFRVLGKKYNYEMSLGMFFGVQWEPKWGSHNTWRGKKHEPWREK